MNVSIKDIAKLAGVSKMTVSRVINKSSNVRAETKERIERIIDEQGYQRNLLAGSLSKGVALDVVAIITGIENIFGKYYFTELIKQIEEALDEYGFSVYIYNVLETENKEVIEKKLKIISDSYYSKMIKGAIVLAPPIGDMRIEYLSKHNVKGVVVGSDYADENFSCINIDDKKSVINIVDYLVSLGHKEIAMLTGPSYMDSAIMREKAFILAMKKNNLPIRNEFIKCGSYNRCGGKLAALELLSYKKRPSAIFASNDDMALGVYDALKELGLEIVHDVSVVGFDDIYEARELKPALTTIAQPYKKYANLIAEIFYKGEYMKCSNLEANFIKRDSVGVLK